MPRPGRGRACQAVPLFISAALVASLSFFLSWWVSPSWGLVTVAPGSVSGIPSSLLEFKAGRAPLAVGIAERQDCSRVAKLLVECFPPLELTISEDELFSWEAKALKGPVEFYNKYFKSVNEAEVRLGLRARGKGRWVEEGSASLEASRDALILSVFDPQAEGALLAVVELYLRKPDPALPGNFPLRSLLPLPVSEECKPYLCNLAVVPELRGQGVGRQLTRLAEYVVRSQWGYDELYLHVDVDEPIALGLYRSMGYSPCDFPPTPEWIRTLLGIPDVQLQRKSLTF